MHHRFLIALAIPLSIVVPQPALAQSNNLHYGLRYDLTLQPAEGRALVSLTIDERAKGNILSMRFHIKRDRHQGFKGDGTIDISGEYVTWTPPESGGRFRFHVPVDNLRPNDRYDAVMRDHWAIFRGDDLFPPAQTEQRDDAEADATLHVHLPEGWSFACAYDEIEDDVFSIEHLHRSFDRPTGWMAAGKLGVRRELIAGARVIVAGPMNQGVRRLDLIAHLNWNLPRLRKLVGNLPERLLIVSAGDPMWRGGLSGPNSLFIHSDRPLLSENGSSTLIHELVHVATQIEGEKGADWIVEGMAEYYSLKIMWRSGTLTDRRYKHSLEGYEEWGKEAERLDVDVSRGPVTAKAVGIMRDLDREIYRKTEHEKSYDDVVRLLAGKREKINLQKFQDAVIQVLGEPADALSEERTGLPHSPKSD